MTKKPPVDRHRLGAVSKAQGKIFEDRLSAAFDYYRERGLASVDKTPEPMKVLKSIGQGRFMCCFEKKAQPDFTGTVRGGRSVMFEAKFTASDRMEQNRVLPQQADYLTRHQALGARCYVLAGFSTGHVYRIPWSIWAEMKQRFGRKYVREADLEIFLVPVENGRLKLLSRKELTK